MTSSTQRRHVALAQIAQSSDVERTIDRCCEAIVHAAEAGADVVGFAELAHLPFFPQSPDGAVPEEWAETIPGPTTERLQNLARTHGIVIVYNLFERDGRRFYDASPVIDADGTLLGTTRMAHIADFEGFHERRYYAPPEGARNVYETRAGRVGVAICYDRHFPEYMRELGLDGADVVFIPQAGLAGEWTDGLQEAEIRTAAFQNGYFAALVNRVGPDGTLTFGGESFVVGPDGAVLGRAAGGEEDLLVVEVDLGALGRSPGRRLFLPDRRPDLYRGLVETS